MFQLFAAVETIFLFQGPNNTEQSKIKCEVLFVFSIVFKDTHLFSLQHLQVTGNLCLLPFILSEELFLPSVGAQFSHYIHFLESLILFSFTFYFFLLQSIIENNKYQYFIILWPCTTLFFYFQNSICCFGTQELSMERLS